VKAGPTKSVIVDSRLSFPEALAGIGAPLAIIDFLSLLEVMYYSFDGRLHQGQLVVHGRLREELREIFTILQDRHFPLGKVIPIVHYGWSDEASMADNNTSAFNYRLIAGTDRLSNHARGLAIDINPGQNPVIYPDGRSLPPGVVYAPEEPGTIIPEGPVLMAFLSRGWRWGGYFDQIKDYHHFEKAGAGESTGVQEGPRT